MKTSINIPDHELEDVMRFSGASTKREAVVLAIAEYNQRRRLAALVDLAGTCDDLLGADELQVQRRRP